MGFPADRPGKRTVGWPSYTAAVATYEYRCQTCDTQFELRRPMSESSSTATCPDGHPDAVRLLSVFASVSGGPVTGGAPAPRPSMGMGGCGGGCMCH